MAEKGTGRAGRRTLNQDDWDRHPWSRTFDLVSAEYGWTDEQILDLLPTRLRRIAEAITLRNEAEFRRYARLQAAATRSIVAAVHGAQGHKAGVKQAEKIQLIDPEPTVDDLLPKPEVSTEDALRMFGQPLIPMKE